MSVSLTSLPSPTPSGTWSPSGSGWPQTDCVAETLLFYSYGPSLRGLGLQVCISTPVLCGVGHGAQGCVDLGKDSIN